MPRSPARWALIYGVCALVRSVSGHRQSVYPSNFEQRELWGSTELVLVL